MYKTNYTCNIGMFYARAYSSLLKRYSIFFRFGIIDFLSLASFISYFSRFIARNCYSPFTINIKIKCEKTFYNKDNVVEKAT
jgi:hypothetical protein